MKFEELPQCYQDSVNKSIKEWVSQDEQYLIPYFKESFVEYAEGNEMHDTDIIEEDRYDTELVWWIDGWRCREKAKQSRFKRTNPEIRN
jgi:hypothetical protein